MIGDLLSGIKDAEKRAAKIIADAQIQAAKIEHEANEHIRKINADTEDEIAKISLKKTNAELIESNEEIKIEVPKEKLDAAKKFIMSEFYKRFA